MSGTIHPPTQASGLVALVEDMAQIVSELSLRVGRLEAEKAAVMAERDAALADLLEIEGAFDRPGGTA